MGGITVNIREVANMPDFSSYILPSTSWRAPCEKYMGAYEFGEGFPVYDMFPHGAQKNV